MTKTLIVYTPSSSELTEQLGALRCAVQIARALGAQLVLPRWRSGPAWVASDDDVVDAAALATLVPLVSEQAARARCAAVEADQVRCASLGAGGLITGEGLDDLHACLEARGLGLPVLLAARAADVAVEAPMRSAAEIRRLLGEGPEGGVLLLPSLAAHVVSASATALSPSANHTLCRALCTPSPRLQQRAQAGQPGHTPLERTLAVWVGSRAGCAMASDGADEAALAAAAAALVRARELAGVAVVAAGDEAGGAAACVLRLLQQQAGVAAWRSAVPEEEEQPEQEQEQAATRAAEEGGEGAGAARARLHARRCAHWACVQAGVLLVAAQDAQGGWLVRARQALGAARWLNGPSALLEDTAPCASLDHLLKAWAAPTCPGA